MDSPPNSILQNLLDRFLHNPLFQRVVKNTGYIFSAQTVSAGLSMVQGVLTARLLGVVGAGHIGLITQFSSNINRLASFRMGELVVSYVGEFSAADKPQHAAVVFKAAALTEIVSSLVAYGLIVLLAPLGAQIFSGEPNFAHLYALYGLTVLANLMAESATGLLQYFNRFRLLAIITVFQSCVTLAMIVAAFLSKSGLSSIVLAYLSGKVVWAVSISVAAVWQAGKEWGKDWWKAPFSLLSGRWKEVYGFALNTNLSGTLTLITRDSEELWLGGFTTPLQVGYYKIAKAIMGIVLIPVNPLIGTTYREVAREVAMKSWGNVRYLLRSGSLLSAAWTVPAVIGLIFFGQWVVWIYNPEALPESYTTLLILLTGALVVNVFFWNRSVLLPLGMPEYPTKVLLFSAVLKVVGTILLVPRYGTYGMAALLSGFFVITSLVLVWKTIREIRRVEDLPIPQGI